MCVILIAGGEKGEHRITEQIAEDAFQANDDGAGIAWREKRNGKGGIRWAKGLDLKEMIKLCGEVPLPYIGHFRIASCGGVRPELTHPFPIQPDVPLDLEGWTAGQVLFHNGHWHEYGSVIKELAIRGGFKIPGGKWSDSRVMAWMVANIGPGIIEFYHSLGKVVMFGPQVNSNPRSGIYLNGISTDWTLGSEGLLMSNTSWRGARQWKRTNRESTQLPDDAKEGDQTRSQRRTRTANGATQDADGDSRLSQVESNIPDISTPGRTVPRYPFGKRGQLLRRLTPQEMMAWKRASKTLNKQGFPILSAKKWKRLLWAWDLQQKRDQTQQVGEEMSEAVEKAKAALAHPPSTEERIALAVNRLAQFVKPITMH